MPKISMDVVQGVVAAAAAAKESQDRKKELNHNIGIREDEHAMTRERHGLQMQTDALIKEKEKIEVEMKLLELQQMKEQNDMDAMLIKAVDESDLMTVTRLMKRFEELDPDTVSIAQEMAEENEHAAIIKLLSLVQKKIQEKKALDEKMAAESSMKTQQPISKGHCENDSTDIYDGNQQLSSEDIDGNKDEHLPNPEQLSKSSARLPYALLDSLRNASFIEISENDDANTYDGNQQLVSKDIVEGDVTDVTENEEPVSKAESDKEEESITSKIKKMIFGKDGDVKIATESLEQTQEPLSKDIDENEVAEVLKTEENVIKAEGDKQENITSKIKRMIFGKEEDKKIETESLEQTQEPLSKEEDGKIETESLEQIQEPLSKPENVPNEDSNTVLEETTLKEATNIVPEEEPMKENENIPSEEEPKKGFSISATRLKKKIFRK